MKDKTKLEHKHNVVYMAECPKEGCSEKYIGETEKRIIERILDHNNRDKKSHVLKHSKRLITHTLLDQQFSNTTR